MEMDKPGAAKLQASNRNNFFFYSNQIFYTTKKFLLHGQTYDHQ